MFSMNSLFWYYDFNVRKNNELVFHLNLFEKTNLTKAEMAFGS